MAHQLVAVALVFFLVTAGSVPSAANAPTASPLPSPSLASSPATSTATAATSPKKSDTVATPKSAPSEESSAPAPFTSNDDEAPVAAPTSGPGPSQAPITGVSDGPALESESQEFEGPAAGGPAQGPAADESSASMVKITSIAAVLAAVAGFFAY